MNNLKLIVLLILLLEVSGKGKSAERIKKEECEKLDLCKYDITENCVLRCISENCYIKVYGNYNLEFGEADRDRSKLFSDCFKSEGKELKANRQRH